MSLTAKEIAIKAAAHRASMASIEAKLRFEIDKLKASMQVSMAMQTYNDIDFATLVTIVPSWYDARLLWRRLWPFARRREKVALITAVLTGTALSERGAHIAHERLWRRLHNTVYGVDRHQKIMDARVRDLCPALTSDPSGPNRVAAFEDGRVYRYRVD